MGPIEEMISGMCKELAEYEWRRESFEFLGTTSDAKYFAGLVDILGDAGDRQSKDEIVLSFIITKQIRNIIMMDYSGYIHYSLPRCLKMRPAAPGGRDFRNEQWHRKNVNIFSRSLLHPIYQKLLDGEIFDILSQMDDSDYLKQKCEYFQKMI